MGMPRRVSSSLMEGANLRLMQCLLGPACMLMGQAAKFVSGCKNQGRSSPLVLPDLALRGAPARSRPLGKASGVHPSQLDPG
jgi:hypothetical protein